MPASCSARIAPMCAQPRAAPPPSTRPMRLYRLRVAIVVFSLVCRRFLFGPWRSAFVFGPLSKPSLPAALLAPADPPPSVPAHHVRARGRVDDVIDVEMHVEEALFRDAALAPLPAPYRLGLERIYGHFAGLAEQAAHFVFRHA